MNRTIIASAASTAFFAAAAILAGPTPSFAQVSGQLVSTGNATAASAPRVSEVVVTKNTPAPAGDGVRDLLIFNATAGTATPDHKMGGGNLAAPPEQPAETREHILLARQVGVPAAAPETNNTSLGYGPRVNGGPVSLLPMGGQNGDNIYRGH